MRSRILSSFWAVLTVVLAATIAEAETPTSMGTVTQQRGGPLSRSLNRQNSRDNRLLRTAGSGSAGALAGEEHPNDGGKVESGGRSIEFNAAPLEIVFKVYGELTSKTVLKDPATPAAAITLQPLQGQELSDEEKILAIETVLEMNGVHLEPYGEKFVRALPRKEVRKDGIPLFLDPEMELKESSRVISLMLPAFDNISIEEAQKALEGFKSASGVLNVFERTSSILVTDTEANVKRMREIAKLINVPTPVLENVFVRQIRNAAAADIKTALEAIVQESQKELEKNGKRTQVAAAPTTSVPPIIGASRPFRSGANNAQAAAANNASVVTTVSDADRGMIRGKVLILSDDRSNKLIVVTSKSNMDFFDKVIEELDVETTPDTVVRVYRLKYAESDDVSDMINDLIGNAASSKSSGKGNQNAASKNAASRGGNMTSGTTTAMPRKSANQRTGEAKAGELSKENTTVLSDKRINGLVVMTNKELVPVIESIIESMDIKLSQVLIETVIIEVGLGDDLKTGMDWVQKGREKTTTSQQVVNEYGQKMYYVKNSTTGLLTGSTRPEGWTGDSESSLELSDVPVLKNVTEVFRNGIGNYYTSGTAVGLGGGANNGGSAYDAVGGMATNVLGRAFNFVFDSDELGLAGILQASKSDSRTKYIASPIIMTLDNKEAKIEATQMRYLFKGYQYSGSAYNGSPVPDYEQKELGITIKVTPKINPNGTVMLTIEEEYSQMGGKQAITGTTGKDINAENTVTRKMSADALLENNQTVIFAGLTQTSTSESESGIPFLKDIPYIGKWLFGSVEQSESRSELLVFMTPYVLNDADAAEAEAIRRKRSISDANAWDDHGWSASKLADPVTKKEQMRRLKDEWKKQDAERQAKLEIEKAKLERAKKLKELSVEERNLWLKMHQKELEEEQQEELEKKMLDNDSQEELKKLAEKIRSEKLSAAEEEIQDGAEKVHSENERAKLDAEKAKAADK